MKLGKFLDHGAEGLIGGVVAAVIFLCYLISCLGCVSTTPCIPEIETITVYVPSLSCPEPEILPTLTYPDWPEVPYGGSQVALKAWYADVVATLRARERILLTRISTLVLLLDSYRTEDDAQ
ncbi:hypothetical protein LCGC14_0344720 [marine sediment metagenome]|uniref:Uncharacterized protein n=1 Tax=marine sediment metagenome TaxID=412755 RepID=A0A0F9W006_9ZZZZ